MAEPLYEAIVAADERGAIAALRGRSEAERRALAPPLLRVEHDADATGVDLVDGVPVATRHRQGEGDLTGYNQRSAVDLALLGTASLTELRRVGAWRLAFADDAPAATLLLDRRPPWLDSFAEWILGAETWRPPWRMVRHLVRAGAIERPPAPLYLRGLISTARDEPHAPGLLADDPALLEQDVWDVLAFAGGDDTLRAADDSGAQWADAIAECTLDDRMPRVRVLDALLDAIAGDLSAYQSAWHTRLWKRLEVTDDERLSRTARLRTLLGAPAAPVVGFAVDELLRGGGAPPAELGPALTASAKKTVRGALKLLDAADPAEAAAAAVVALGHEAADIQGEVLDRLERWGASSAALLAHLDLLAATVRPRAEALLGLAGLGETGESAEAPDVTSIPPAIQAALNFGGPIPPAPVPGEPVLGEPIAPIDTLDELARELTTALADPWSSADERLLDGILRHCGDRTPFEGPLRPLVPTLEELAEQAWGNSVPMVAAAWHAGRELVADHHDETRARRLAAAAARAAQGDAGPLLAAPSHVGGWIAPAVLADRLRAVPEVDEAEFTQAILRLAPDGREAALADDLPAPLRCALGADVDPGERPAADAARAVRDPPLIELRFDVRTQRRAWSDRRIEVVRLAPRRLPAGTLGELVDVASGGLRWGEQSVDSTGCPWRREIACASAIVRIDHNLGDGEAGPSGVAEVLTPLIAPNEPLPPLALRLLTLALGSKAEREYLLAVDILVAAIADGRVDAHGLAPGLAEDIASGCLMTSRIGTRLTTLAAAGPLHRAVVRDLLDATAHALEPLPTRTHAALLVPFDELCAQSATGVQNEKTRAFLATLSGSSKAAKLAKALLARPGEPPEAERALALAARVRRAERWLSA